MALSLASSLTAATRIPEVLMTVVGAVATGVGVLGWITFVGGSIIWVRAEQASLPATEAVAVTPRPVLLGIGAIAR